MELNEFEIADLQDLILEFSNGGQWDYLRTGSEQTLAEFLPLLTTNTILENPGYSPFGKFNIITLVVFMIIGIPANLLLIIITVRLQYKYM